MTGTLLGLFQQEADDRQLQDMIFLDMNITTFVISLPLRTFSRNLENVTPSLYNPTFPVSIDL